MRMRWKISKYRKDRRTGPIITYPRSDYMMYLWGKTSFDECCCQFCGEWTGGGPCEDCKKFIDEA